MHISGTELVTHWVLNLCLSKFVPKTKVPENFCYSICAMNRNTELISFLSIVEQFISIAVFWPENKSRSGHYLLFWLLALVITMRIFTVNTYIIYNPKILRGSFWHRDNNGSPRKNFDRYTNWFTYIYIQLKTLLHHAYLIKNHTQRHWYMWFVLMGSKQYWRAIKCKIEQELEVKEKTSIQSYCNWN